MPPIHVCLKKLRDLKYIYVLYFLADIVLMLTKLWKIFQQKLINISYVGSILKSENATIIMCLLWIHVI
jgi:hypothetical protein